MNKLIKRSLVSTLFIPHLALALAFPCTMEKSNQCPQTIADNGVVFKFRGANWQNEIVECIYYHGQRAEYQTQYCEIGQVAKPGGNWRAISVNLNIWVCGFLTADTDAKGCKILLLNKNE